MVKEYIDRGKTEVEGYKKLTEQHKELIDEFLKSIFPALEQQRNFRGYETAMTQEFFENCMERCIEKGDERSFFGLLSSYPEFAKKYAEKIESEVVKVELPLELMEQEEEQYEKLIMKIKERSKEESFAGHL